MLTFELKWNHRKESTSLKSLSSFQISYELLWSSLYPSSLPTNIHAFKITPHKHKQEFQLSSGKIYSYA